MKISHNKLVSLIRECMMDMELESERYPKFAKVIKMDYDAKELDHMHMPKTKRGRMLDYGSVKSDSEEGRMVKGDLHNIARMATELKHMLHDDDDLPEWVQSKIATVKDRLESCYSYLQHELSDYEDDNRY